MVRLGQQGNELVLSLTVLLLCLFTANITGPAQSDGAASSERPVVKSISLINR